MRLTVYRVGTAYSLRDSYEADAITLEVPPGTEVLPFAKLGAVAFVPADRLSRTMHEARDLMFKAHDRHQGFRVLETLSGAERVLRDRIERITGELAEIHKRKTG